MLGIDTSRAIRNPKQLAYPHQPVSVVLDHPTPTKGFGTPGFVARYLGDQRNFRNKEVLTAKEVRELHDNNLSIVSVFQRSSNNDSYFTKQHGIRDATEARQQAIALGQPFYAPIYFAVDYTPKDKFTNIEQYFEGVNEVIGADFPVGVYGTANVLERLRNTGAATFFWQAAEGSRNNTWPDADIRQLLPIDAKFPGTALQVDYNLSPNGNPGSW